MFFKVKFHSKLSSSHRISPAKRRPLALTLAIGAFLLIMFQNFQPIPLDRLKPDFAHAHPVSPTDGTADMRRLAPVRAQPQGQEMIAKPSSGKDMSSISQDWMSRQAHLITGGAEERMLADFNKKMNRMLKFEEEEGEPYPESGFDSSNDGASSSGESADDKSSKGKKAHRGPASIARAAKKDSADYFGLRPTAMQLTAVNRLQLSLRNRTQVSCQFEGANVKWDVRRPINERFDLSFGHETSEAKSTVRLNYNW